MAARSTRVTIRNQTGATLRHVDDSLDHGEWTAPLTPPAEIPGGATVWWQSESNGAGTGTEGHARYAVAENGDVLTFHWDNPFVGANFYEQSVSGPYGLYFSGGTGNNAEVVYSLIPDCRMAVAFYLPSTHGFGFGNHWPDEHITSITLPDPFGDILVGNAAWGLCGGMAFASRDYFEARMWAPTQSTNPRGEGDPLFDYIVQRLAQSLNVGDAADFVKYADPVYPDTDDPTLGDGRNWVMAHVAFPAIRGVIDSGHPCPIGLVIGHLPNVTDMGHQVCVYAYQLSGQNLVLWVYRSELARPRRHHAATRYFPDGPSADRRSQQGQRRARAHLLLYAVVRTAFSGAGAACRLLLGPAVSRRQLRQGSQSSHGNRAWR